MSLMDFDPNRYVVLNWLALTKLAYPDLDWSDKADVLYKTKVLLESIDIVRGDYFYYKSSISRAKAVELGVVRGAVSLTVQELPWLLPSGLLIDAPAFAGPARLAWFEVGGKKFVEYVDGTFVCVTPEIDERIVNLCWPEATGVLVEPKVEIEYFDEGEG